MHFVGHLLEVCRVAQVGRQKYRLVRKRERIYAYASRKRARVAADQYVALGIAEHVFYAEQVFQCHFRHGVRNQGLVLESLVAQQVLLALAQSDRGAGGRVGIGVKVEDLVSVKAVHVYVLVDDARGDGDIVRGLKQQGQAAAEASAVVHVLFRSSRFAKRVDEARVFRPVGDHAHGRRLSQGNVEGRFEMTSERVFADEVHVDFGLGFDDAQLRLVGYVAHGAADGAGTEKRALRSSQGFDAVQVEQVEVRREQRKRDRSFVQVDSHLLLHSRLVAHYLSRGNAADVHDALSGSEILYGKSRNVVRKLFDVGGVEALKFFFGLHVNGKTDVLHVRLSPGGRHYHLLQAVASGHPRVRVVARIILAGRRALAVRGFFSLRNDG